MATFSGGDVVNMTYNHPTIGSGTMFCKSGEDGNYDPGGKRTNDDANSITGSGQMMQSMNNVLASYENTVAWDMKGQNELYILKQLAGSDVMADWTITVINGSVISGKGKPVGDIQGNTNTAEISVKITFEGEPDMFGV